MARFARTRALVARHRRLVVAAAIAMVALLVFVLVWFQPQKVFLNNTVNEGLPSSAPAPSATGSPSAATRGGNFRSLEHTTTGHASLLTLGDGSHVVRFDDLRTSNGPVLHVYLSELPSTLGDREYGKRFLDLGGLKGNIGDQNYPIPAGTDLSRFHSVVIWCVRFNVGFGVAPFEA